MAKRNSMLNGAIIRKRCNKKNLSLHKLSREVGLKGGWGTFRHYVYEESKCPPEVIKKICKVLKVDEQIIVDRADYDVKQQIIANLKNMQVSLLLGDEDVTMVDYAKALSQAAPYFYSKKFAISGFDSAAFAAALEKAKAAVASGKETPELSDVERQQLEL